MHSRNLEVLPLAAVLAAGAASAKPASAEDPACTPLLRAEVRSTTGTLP